MKERRKKQNIKAFGCEGEEGGRETALEREGKATV